MDRTFRTPGPTTIRVRIPSGRISLEAIETQDTLVQVEGIDAGDADAPKVGGTEAPGRSVVTVEATNGHRRRHRRDYDVRIRCPLGSDVEIKTASADVEGRGRFGAFEVNTASGDVDVDEVQGSARTHTASGNVRIGSVTGSLEAKGASGDLAVGRAGGPVRATLASGDMRIGRADSAVQANTASGDQVIEAVGGGTVWLQTVSGEVTVGVLPGVEVWLDLQSLSGDTISDLTPSSDPPQGNLGLEVRLRSVSGDLRVHRATAADPPSGSGGIAWAGTL